MERNFLGVAAGNEQRQRAAEDEGRKESAYFGAGGAPTMDWSFGSRGGSAPGVMSFRSAPREEQGLSQFSNFSAAQKQQQASRVLTQQRSFGAESLGSAQFPATRGAYGGQPQQQHVFNGAYGGQAPQQQQQQQQQHAVNGARVVPVSSPLNPNNAMFKVQSAPSLPNGVAAAAGQFKQPPFAVNNAVSNSRVGVYARNMPKPKMAQLTIFYAGSVNVFNNVSAEKAQELMLLASRGSLPSAPSAVARSPDVNFFAPAKVAAPEVSPATQMLPQKQPRFSPPASGISTQISNMSQAVCPPRSAPSTIIDLTGPKSSGQLVVPPMSQSPSTRPVTLASSGQLVVPPMSQPSSTRPVTLASSGQLVAPPMSQPPARPVTLASSSQLVAPPTSQPPSSRLVTLARPVTQVATTATTIMPRAVPQARKASLARFLEKRKERVTTVAPYQSAKSPMESNDTDGSANDNSKSSCTGISFSSNSDNSLCLGRPRSIISFSGECPSTNLHI